VPAIIAAAAITPTAFDARITLFPTTFWGNEYSVESAIPFAWAVHFELNLSIIGSTLLTNHLLTYVKVHGSEEPVVARRLLNSKKKPRVPWGMRVYAIGDVHGRADLLNAMFGRIDADLAQQPSLESVEVFLGDYIDRGPHSRRVLDLLIARGRKHQMICLKGNHETYISQVASDPSIISEWQQMGGTTTLLSYGVKPPAHPNPEATCNAARAFDRALPEMHRRFIAGLELSYTCGDFFFAHAGVRPGVALAEQSAHDLMWIRDDFLLHEEDFGKIIVHGHTPATEPEVRRNRINIDTGAYATGRLTCLVLEADQMRFL
jgi:serine/threonine protein phosphatase 1